MKRISIIQTADIHGRIHDYPYIAAYIKQLRQSGEPVLVVDSGDIFRGHILSEFSNGLAAAEIMNTIGYDYMVFGNDEHFKGVGEINAMRQRLNFPVLGAMTRQMDGSRVFDPWGITERGGFRIGVIGLEPKMMGMPPGMPGMQADASLTDPYEEAAEAETLLRAKGCDLVMVVCHLGVDDTYHFPSPELARRVPGIDLIADGHSHHPLPEGIVVGSTLITQPADRMASFVHITVTVHDNGVFAKSCRLISIDQCKSELDPEPNVLAILQREQAKIDANTVVLGHTPYLLDGGRPQIRCRETNLGDIVCDAFAYAAGVQIAFCGGGNIRASIEPGNITTFDVNSVFANSSKVSLGRCSGSWILKKMEKGLESYPVQSPGFTHVSGLNILFDPNAEPGSRIVSAELETGEKLERDKLYQVAGTLPIGGPGHEINDVEGCEMLGDICSDVEAFTKYLQSGHARLYETPLGRIKALE